MSLNVTVTPGHTFTDNETVTTGKLNAAATPTVAVSGSIDASELGANSVGTTQLANESVTATKMGVAALQASAPGGFTMNPQTHSNKKGVILASGAIDGGTAGQFDELWAGSPNSFLIGHATRTDSTWTGDWSVRSKVLSSNSSIFVDQQDASSITMLIKENAITQSMMQGQSIGNEELGSYSVTLDKITPGGGAASNNSGGIAKDSNNFWAGIMQFNPAQEAGSTGWNGKAEALQASEKNQVVYAQGISQKLVFAHHPCIPKAFASIHSNADHGSGNNYTNSDFTFLAKHGIEEIRKVNAPTQAGEYKIKLESGYEDLWTGDAPTIFGWGSTGTSDVNGSYPVIVKYQAAIDGNREFTIRVHASVNGLGNQISFNSLHFYLY